MEGPVSTPSRLQGRATIDEMTPSRQRAGKGAVRPPALPAAPRRGPKGSGQFSRLRPDPPTRPVASAI